MCEKHPWKSDILSKNRGRLTAALFKMALFHWCFAYILLVKINYIVSPYRKHRPQMSYCNPWCPHSFKVFQCVYLYHSLLHHIHILQSVVVIFGITTVQKSGATETSKAKRLQWCNYRMWLHKPFYLVFKYRLIDFVFYHTKVWWAKFTEANRKTVTV